MKWNSRSSSLRGRTWDGSRGRPSHQRRPDLVARDWAEVDDASLGLAF
jgi:hypothetical protein